MPTNLKSQTVDVPTAVEQLAPSQKLVHVMEIPPKPVVVPGYIAWIPFYQSLLWPVVVLVFLLIYRRPLHAALHYIGERIKGGSSLEVAGIKMGAALRPAELQRKGEDPAIPTDLPNTIYMSHHAMRDPSVDRGGRQYYRLDIFLDADTPELLSQIERVVYHLHPTFDNPDRESSDKDGRFEIKTIAWGEFNMTADVYLKEKSVPLKIERYISF